MKVNQNEISQFDKLLKECQLVDVVSDEFKQFQKKRKKVLYKRILIRIGLYSFFTGIVVYVFFGIKKISVIFGGKLLVTSLFIAASASSVIIYKTFEQTDNLTIQFEVDDKKAATFAPKQPESKSIITHYTLGMQPFKSGSVDQETLNKVNLYMLQALKTTGSGSYAASLSEIGEDKVTYLVNQSIEKVENSYYIQIKIIDKNTSAIIFASKGTAESENNLQNICNDIARQVISAVK